MAQVDFKSIDNACIIQGSGNNMLGLTKTSATLSASGGTLTYQYTIPTIPDACAGKTLTLTQAAFYTGSTGITRYPFTAISGITLNQCYEKTLIPITSTTTGKTYYVVDAGCYFRSCYNYRLYPILVVPTPVSIY
jgi:hypothetical protein